MSLNCLGYVEELPICNEPDRLLLRCNTRARLLQPGMGSCIVTALT